MKKASLRKHRGTYPINAPKAVIPSDLSAVALAQAEVEGSRGIYCQKCKDSSTPLRSVGMTKARKVAENQ